MPEDHNQSKSLPKTAKERSVSNHAAFVLDWITNYRFRFYRDRAVHEGKIGIGTQSWSDKDHQLAIEEGRRQIDDQFTQLQYVTTRASVLLTVGLVVIGFLLTRIEGITITNLSWQRVHHIGHLAQLIVAGLLWAGTAMAFWGTLIMGALIAGRSQFRRTDAIQITNQKGPLVEYLSLDYAESIRTGENTNAARLTHIGIGLRWIVAGAFAGVLSVAVKLFLY